MLHEVDEFAEFELASGVMGGQTAMRGALAFDRSAELPHIKRLMDFAEVFQELGLAFVENFPLVEMARLLNVSNPD